MTATRIIDSHLELANIGAKTHAQIESHIQGICNYAFPSADGALNQILETDGAGALSWVNKPVGFACANLSACSLSQLGTRPHSQLTGIGASDHHTDHQAASAEDAQFKSVNIPTGEAYKQNMVNILKAQATGNMFIGEDTGPLTTGNYNMFIGRQAGKSNTTGLGNGFIGADAGYSNINGNYNFFLGYSTGYSNTNGNANVFIGNWSGYSNLGGVANVFIGYAAGYSNVSGGRSVFIGYRAGYSETSGYRLYIAGDSTDALTLIHGEFDNKYLFHKGAASAPADAKLHNSDINFWIDEVNDQLEIKIKKSDGTVITGNVQLA